MNPNLYYGLGGGCDTAALQWAWLLSLHDGSVLVFPEDLQQQAVGTMVETTALRTWGDVGKTWEKRRKLGISP
jgi:hypothetical protein